jgi:hypothetical protein
MSEIDKINVKTPGSVYLEARHSPFVMVPMFFSLVLMPMLLMMDFGSDTIQWIWSWWGVLMAVAWLILLAQFFAMFLTGPIIIVGPLGLYVRSSETLFPWLAITDVVEQRQGIRLKTDQTFVPGFSRSLNLRAIVLAWPRTSENDQVRISSLTYSKDEIVRAIRHYKPDA